MHQRTGAHAARFQCDVERRARQTVVALDACRVAQGNNFRVSGGVSIANDSVPAAPEDVSVAHNQRAHGHLALLRGAIRQ